MTQFFLANDVSLSQGGQTARLPAGKLVDSANQNVTAIIAAGGVLFSKTTNAAQQAALLTKYKRYKGQGLLLDVARELPGLSPLIVGAFTTVAAPGFIMPTQDGATPVSVPLTSPPGSTWLTVGATIFIATAGYLQVTAILDVTHVTVVNPIGYSGNAVSGIVIAAGVGVQAAGIKGIDGLTGGTGATGAGPCGSFGTGPVTGTMDPTVGAAITLPVPCITANRCYRIVATCIARSEQAGGPAPLNDSWTQRITVLARNDAGVLTISNNGTAIFTDQAIGEPSMVTGGSMALQAVASGTNINILAIGNYYINVTLSSDTWVSA